MSLQKNERMGEAFALGSVVFSASLPLFIVLSKNIFPPLFFIGMTFLLAGIFLLPFALYFERDRFLPNKQAAVSMLIGSGIIMFFFYPLLTYVGQNTSAGNIAILTRVETFYNFLYFGLLGIEIVTPKRVFGSLFVVAGAIAILFQNFSGEVSYWDFLLLLVVAIPPFANHRQKLALNGIGPLSMVAIRNLIGGTILLGIAIWFEPVTFSNLNSHNFILIILNSIFAFGISTWLGFKAYPMIGVTKTIAISSASPAFTLLLAFVFLREYPTFTQLLGLLFVSIGVLFIIHKQITKLEGKVVSGDKIGRKIGFPTINLETKTKIPSGIYAVKTTIQNKEFIGAMHVGKRPTFDRKEWRTEIHLLDFTGAVKDGESVRVEIFKRLRGVKKYSNTEKLIRQIKQDVTDTREVFRIPV